MSDGKPFRPIVSMSETRRLSVTNPQHLAMQYGQLKLEYTKLKHDNEKLNELVMEAAMFARALAPTIVVWKKWLRKFDELNKIKKEREG